MRFVLTLMFCVLSSAAAACPLVTDTRFMPPATLERAVETCIAQGVDLNSKDARGNPMFHRIIATGGSPRAVELALGAGADPNIATPNGSPAFVDLVNFSHPDDEATVVEILEVLGQAGARFSTPDSNGDLALSKAAGGGELDTVRVLLRWRADPNGLNTYDRTPLFETVFGRCSPDVGRLLIANGARVDVMAQDQIDRMLAEGEDSCASVRGGRAYLAELATLAGR